MSKSGSFSVKHLDGIYSKKRSVSNDIIASPSLNSPISSHFHSSKNSSLVSGFFSDVSAGRYWNQVFYDEVNDCAVLGQDAALDKRSNKKQDGYYVDLLETNINDSIDTNYFNLNRDFLEVFPIRSEAVGIDDIFFPSEPRGISADALNGIQNENYVMFSYVDSDFFGEPVIKGFYNDSVYTVDTGSYAKKSFQTGSYSKYGKVKFAGFFNESLSRFSVVSGSSTYAVVVSGAYVDSDGNPKKNLIQGALSARSSSKPSPYAQVNMRTVGGFIGINENEIASIRNNWHFVSSGSRNSGDKNVISTVCGRQKWTSANAPTNAEMMGSSQLNLLPPIRRSYKYDIRDADNIENRIECVMSSTNGEEDYFIRHVNYKDLAADQKSFTVGVDSLTTNYDEQLISTAINEPIGDELYERGTHKFLESFKTLSFKVSSSLTPTLINEFQIGVHPLQIVRPYSMPKFPQGSNVSFIDDVQLPVGPFGIQDVEPLEGLDFFEPCRKLIPRIFVPEHYITGALGGATEDSSNTLYNPEWAADPEGGRVWSHWGQHTTSIGSVNVAGNISELYTTSSFFGETNASSDLKKRSFSNGLFDRGIRPIVKSLSEFNDYFQRTNQKYSIAHKQTFNVLSGSGNGLRSVGVRFAGVHAAYPFSASLTFYSCSNGVIADSITLGPYFSTSSFIARNTVGTFSSFSDDQAGRYCLLPSGLDRNNSAKPDPEGADFNFSWHSSSNFRTEDAFGYFKPVTTVLIDDFSRYGLSTASIKTEAVLFHEIIDDSSFPDIDLNKFNTSSITIDFLTTLERKNFLKNSSDRSTNAIGYDNLYDELEGVSGFDACAIPFRSNMAHYCVGFTGSVDGDIVTTTGSVAFAFLMSKERGDTSGFSENYGDVRSFPNAMVVPGVRPFREDRNLSVSKSFNLTSGTIHWANAAIDAETPSQRVFFIGNDDLTKAKVEKSDPDYCKSAYSSICDSSDSGIFGIGIEGSYGFKNYIRNEGIEHNKSFYDVTVGTLGTDHPSWFGDGTTKAFYYVTDFYGLTVEDVQKLYTSYSERPETFKDLFVHGTPSVGDDMIFSVNRRVPPEHYSNLQHTIFLQYPKSYATSSSGISAVTYSFERGGPLSMSNYGKISTDNSSDFNNTSFLFTLMSESKDANTELIADDRGAILFNNHDSNFIMVQDSASVQSALEVGAKANMPNTTMKNLLTNSCGDFVVHSSITNNKKWTFGTLSSSIVDKTVVHGSGFGTKINFFAPDPYKINNSQIGIGCSSSVVAQFGPGLNTDNGYSVASGTMGYFDSSVGPNISFASVGTLHRKVYENSSLDFSTTNKFDWVAEPTMAASQVNFWSGTVRIVATSSNQEITGVAGNVYPTDETDRIKSDAFVNFPVINASFSRLEPDNIIASPGLNGGNSSSTKGEHFSASIVFGGTGSMIFGFRDDGSGVAEPVSVCMRKFQIKQYQKTQAGYGDDDYIKRVNQKMYHDVGIRVLTESITNPSFPVIADSSFMLQKDSGEYNYTLYDKSDVFKDNKITGSSVRKKAISPIAEFGNYASSSQFFQKFNRVVVFNTGFGHNAHLMEQTIGANMFSEWKGYSVYYTSSAGIEQLTGSLPLTDI
jgi:hypothetical protein